MENQYIHPWSVKSRAEPARLAIGLRVWPGKIHQQRQ
jgi:hypothetical protein